MVLVLLLLVLLLVLVLVLLLITTLAPALPRGVCRIIVWHYHHIAGQNQAARANTGGGGGGARAGTPAGLDCVLESMRASPPVLFGLNSTTSGGGGGGTDTDDDDVRMTSFPATDESVRHFRQKQTLRARLRLPYILSATI